MAKIIEAYPKAGKTAHTAPAWQYDYGQLLHINGITLPASYKAEFSNTSRGDAIATVQTTDTVAIPAQFLESGNPVYIWLVVVDESSRTTEYALIVPVAARAKPTDEEPTPEEQSEIDQTLAALNSGVELVEQIADAIPDTINDALEAAKESGEFDGEDGFSPEVTVAPIQGGHRITITDANGIHTVDVLDGAKGDTGRGIVSVQKTGTAGLVDTYTITYTDSTTSTFTVTNGQDGNPGADGTTFTPAVSAEGVISWTNDGGKPNPQPVNIKGPQGDDYILTAADKQEIAQQAAEEVDVPVQDVQVNGVSVLTGGVANVPRMTINQFGVTKIGYSSESGLELNSSGVLKVSHASAAKIKSGDSAVMPITTDIQHTSAFYGLAKAAGADMASSSNPVGTYTDAAKVAIQKMLGIYEPPFELVNDFTLETESAFDLTADMNGTPYNLLGVFVVYTYSAGLAAASSGYGRLRLSNANGVSITAETGRAGASQYDSFKYVHMQKTESLTLLNYTAKQTNGSSAVWQVKAFNVGVAFNFGNVVKIDTVGDIEPAGTRIRIYGQRAY